MIQQLEQIDQVETNEMGHHKLYCYKGIHSKIYQDVNMNDDEHKESISSDGPDQIEERDRLLGIIDSKAGLEVLNKIVLSIQDVKEDYSFKDNKQEEESYEEKGKEKLPFGLFKGLIIFLHSSIILKLRLGSFQSHRIYDGRRFVHEV